jgi:hypothetical protein
LAGAFVNINIFLLKIHSFENASTVNIVQNLLANWRNFDKRLKNMIKILVMRVRSLAHKVW